MSQMSDPDQSAPSSNGSRLRFTGHADVVSDKPQRYAKQLASHFGRKREIVETENSSRIIFDAAECLLEWPDGSLRITSFADSEEALAHVESVIGSHLVRFGARNELSVTWQR